MLYWDAFLFFISHEIWSKKLILIFSYHIVYVATLHKFKINKLFYFPKVIFQILHKISQSLLYNRSINYSKFNLWICLKLISTTFLHIIRQYEKFLTFMLWNNFSLVKHFHIYKTFCKFSPFYLFPSYGKVYKFCVNFSQNNDFNIFSKNFLYFLQHSIYKMPMSEENKKVSVMCQT